MNNRIDLGLGFWTTDSMGHTEITTLLGINPIKIYYKGQPKNPRFLALSKKNGWVMAASPRNMLPFDEQMTLLLDFIESKFDVFQVLCDRYYCEISCAVFLYFGNEESTPWIHLDRRFMDLSSKLKIEFDIDMYNWPNKN